MKTEFFILTSLCFALIFLCAYLAILAGTRKNNYKAIEKEYFKILEESQMMDDINLKLHAKINELEKKVDRLTKKRDSKGRFLPSKTE